MSALIDELKQGHQILTQLLAEVRRHGVTSAEGLRKLLAAKAVLLEHLKAEDERLYPVLEQAAGEDELLARTLRTFARDRESISKDAIAFFEKYSEGGDALEFAKDYGHVYAMLTTRISREENVLYKEYERVGLG